MSTSTNPSPASPAHPAFEHVAIFHDGVEELATLVVDDIATAVERGDGVLVCVDDVAADLIRRRLGAAASSVTFVSDDVRYDKPAEALKIVHDFARRCMRTGAPAVWSYGAIPYDGRRDAEWTRYEAAVNDVLAHLPFKGVCLFDLTSSDPERLADAAATHTTVVDRNGRRASAIRSAVRFDVDPIALPDRASDLHALPGDAAAARHAIRAILDRPATDPLLIDSELVASELVTNAFLHGDEPVELDVWVATSEVIVAVTDRGPGIDDPYFELRPPRGQIGGAGLWIIGQLADRVESRRRFDGSHRVVARIVTADR